MNALPASELRLAENKAQRMPAVIAKHEQIANEQGRPKMNKDQNHKVTGQQELPARPAVPPSNQ